MTELNIATKENTAVEFELVRHGELLALRTRDQRVYGFHADTMDVAALAPQAWTALKTINSPSRKSELASGSAEEILEALSELKLWEQDRAEVRSQRIREPAIRSLTINVAQVCNLACTYCAAGGDGTYGSKTKTPDLEKTKQLLSQLLQKVPAGEKFVLTFLGGEPLLHPHILRSVERHAKLVTAGRHVQLRFDIVTNGTLVTEDSAEMLAAMGANVTVSIDGHPDDNDKSRVTKSGKGSSAQVLKGLAELLKVRERLGSLSAGAVFGKHGTNIVCAWEFLASFPFDSMKFDFAAEAGDEVSSRAFAKGISEVADLAYARGGEQELRRLHVFDHLFRALDDRARIENHCLAGKNHLQLDTDGRLTACQWFVGQKEEELGSTESAELTLNNPVLQGFSQPLIEKHGCGTCWARHICGGGCMHVNKIKNGNKHKVDHAFCERTRTIIAKGIERYAESRYEPSRRDARVDGDTSEIH